MNYSLDDEKKYEKELFYKIKNNDRKALDELYLRHEKFIISMCKKHCTDCEFHELIAECNLGFMTAVNQFIPDKGIKFSTFLYYKLLERIFYVKKRNINPNIKVSGGRSAELSSFKKCINEARLLNVEKLEEYVCTKLNISPKKFNYLNSLCQPTLDISEIALPSQYNLEEDIIRKSLVNKIKFYITKLDYQEQVLIYRLFFKGDTLSSIAKDLKISPYEIKKIKLSALKKLSIYLNDET